MMKISNKFLMLLTRSYTLVVLPETAFSVALNKYPSLNNIASRIIK